MGAGSAGLLSHTKCCCSTYVQSRQPGSPERLLQPLNSGVRCDHTSHMASCQPNSMLTPLATARLALAQCISSSSILFGQLAALTEADWRWNTKAD